MLTANDIPQRLRELRVAAGLSQSAVGAACELPTQKISDYECGRIQPSLPTLCKMLAVVGGDINEFLPIYLAGRG